MYDRVEISVISQDDPAKYDCSPRRCPPHAPLHAFAADEGPQADASSTHSAAGARSGTSAPAQITESPIGSLAIGEHRLISRKEIDQNWDGLDPDYTPENAIAAVKALLSEEDFEALFPYRLGSAEWFKVASGKEYYKADQTDYFSYDNPSTRSRRSPISRSRSARGKELLPHRRFTD